MNMNPNANFVRSNSDLNASVSGGALYLTCINVYGGDKMTLTPVGSN